MSDIGSKSWSAIWILCSCLASTALAQPVNPNNPGGSPTTAETGGLVLTNDLVVKLVEAGVGDDFIIDLIKTAPSRFSVGGDDLTALGSRGVSDKVIQAMSSAASPTLPASPPNSPAPIRSAATAAVRDPRVYATEAGASKELGSVVVRFDRARRVGVIGSAVPGQPSPVAYVSGAHSETQLVAPSHLLIYAPGGAEFQLLHLQSQNDQRRVSAAPSGGRDTGTSSGGAVKFESKELAPQIYLLSFPTLAPGEYGLLTHLRDTASGRSGTIYTFSVVKP
jgi:hypothetical protein